MSDIRNWFAPKGGSSGDAPKKKREKDVDTDELDRAIKKSAKKKGAVVEISDSDDDEKPKSKRGSPAKSAPVSAGPSKTKPEEKQPEPVVDAADFFGGKKVRQVPAPPRKEKDPNAEPVPEPTKGSKKRKSKSPQKKAAAVEDLDDFGDDLEIPDDLLDAANYTQTPNDSQAESAAVHVAPPSPSPAASAVPAAPPKSSSPVKAASRVPSAAPTPVKRQADEVASPEKKKKSPAKRPMEDQKDTEVIDLDAVEDKAPPAKKAKTETSAIPVSVKPPQVPQPSQPQAPASSDAMAGSQSFNMSTLREQRKTGKEVRGAEGCLTGLTFVFTGDFVNFSRAQAEDIVRRYNGKATGSVSSRTSYLVVGTDGGARKTEKAEEINTKRLTEDEFIHLIETLPAKKVVPPSPAKGKGKQAAAVPKPAPSGGNAASMLWTDKYAPKKLDDLIGNPTIKEKLQKFLRDWSPHQEFKAALLSGPPGIGKTTMAHLVSKAEGFQPVEFNASDARSKKILQSVVSGLTANHSMSEYLVGASAESKRKDVVHMPHKTVIIMDEVDGMGGGDRGGNAELIMMIKKTQVPIICICNDRQSTKVRTLSKYCLDLKFRRPDAGQIMKRLLPIVEGEGLKVPSNVVEEIAKMSQSDIRQVLNMLSMYRLSQTSMSWDQGKQLAQSSDKQPTWTIWDLVPKLFRSQDFTHSTLSDKMDLYFYDYSFLPIMVQENYLRSTQPALAKPPPGRHVTPRQMEVATMELLSQAAESISDGDLVENLMRSTNNWTVMPLHSIASCVRPAYFMHGNMGQPSFPATLGNLSKGNKNYRLLKELQLHMRLHISGDKSDVRQSYLPSLLPRITQPLIDQGNEGVAEVIDTMDVYWLTKDDWQSVHDLHLGPDMVAKIPSTTKAAFTREYNKASHPMPFITQTASKVKSGGPKPDMDDIIDLEEDYGDEEEASLGSQSEGEEDGEGGGDLKDLKNDKFLVQKKAAKGSKGGASATKAKGSASSSRAGSGGGRGSRGGRGGKKK